MLLLARAVDTKVEVADPRWRDGVSAAARVGHLMAANALVLAAWIGATAEPGLFEDVSVPLTVVLVGLYAISGITGYRCLMAADPHRWVVAWDGAGQ